MKLSHGEQFAWALCLTFAIIATTGMVLINPDKSSGGTMHITSANSLTDVVLGGVTILLGSLSG